MPVMVFRDKETKQPLRVVVCDDDSACQHQPVGNEEYVLVQPDIYDKYTNVVDAVSAVEQAAGEV